jgi:hypothetical protein
LAANLNAAIPGVQCNGYLLASPTAPGFEIEPGATEYDQSMRRGFDLWTLTVRGYVSDITDIGGQKTLDAWLAASGGVSVKDAIENDPTLGGCVDWCRVTGNAGYRRFGFQSTTYLGSEWTVQAMATGI